MLRRLAGTALTTAAAFLMVVAIMLDSMTLFYMGTAMTVMLLASRLQAYLSIRWLRFDRTGTATVSVGDIVTVEIQCWSEHRVKRPLVIIRDKLPKGLVVSGLTPSLPIAPAYDVPIVTQYQFRALKRGYYRWSGLEAIGYDALGLVRLSKDYQTTPAELIVWPVPIPINVDLKTAAGYGISENESGSSRGAGIEPRGIREYQRGDPLRRIHWRSSARVGTLMVKEFEAGSSLTVAFMIQTTRGTEIGQGAATSLEMMVGNCTFIADVFLQQGAEVAFPGLETKRSRGTTEDRLAEVKTLLTRIQAVSEKGLGEIAAEVSGDLLPGSTLYALLAVADDTLPSAALALSAQGTRLVAILYDANAFASKRSPFRGTSATSPEYVAKLDAAGIQTIFVPMEGRNG